jgi:MFS transporter, UMF1 family
MTTAGDSAVGSRRAVLLRRPVVSWALVDWANSAFATTVMAGFFPVFFKQYWSAGAEVTESTARLAFANSATSLLVALCAPLLGAVADRAGRRISLLAMATVLGAAMTGGLYFVGKGEWPMAVALYAAASLGFWGGNQFYDSLITDVATPREFDLVSAYGYSMGYLGGGLLFLVNVLMVTQPALFGLADAGEGVRVAFLTVAAWWLLFTIPALLFVKEQAPAVRPPVARAIREGIAELRGTLTHLRQHRTVVAFLLAYWFYIDGVNTIIKMAVDYGLSLGLPSNALIKALLLTQFVAFPAALAFGALARRTGPRTGIFIAIGVYTAATIGAAFLHTETHFYILAVVIGLVQGGIQSLSRSYYGRLVPAGKSGEFFGFYNMMGKFASVLGPALAGVTALLTRDPRMAIVSIALLFVIGAVLLARVPADAHAAGN